MGTEKSRPFTDELTQFRVEEENHETNQTHLIHKDTEKEYMLRELTFNEISVYEKSLAEHKKRQALVDPHLTNLSSNSHFTQGSKAGKSTTCAPTSTRFTLCGNIRLAISARS